ncbi:uncharacterized protein LY89DRAFT_686322 [Mollisia scopiformis]|uniref:Uncharacterized protein n=1 Tax=Mollisia scopiformis TaxID=149040 RepID=A0A194X358_MOLSC|nr:uncharacterized protein LY89DRAFT_686322 [Mollisia scopiformis]KUJ14635.1 hypothetical protein LY89DRAFT_686322 [Mollisia scopiformis]
MPRSTYPSGSKWKEVLGFDDEYTSSRHSRKQSTSTSSSQPSNSLWSPQLIYQPTPPSYPRLPRDITFFRSRSDILLSPSSPAPSPNDLKPLPAPPHLFYITVQREYYPNSSNSSTSSAGTSIGRPDLILHSGPCKANTVLSYAKFHPLTEDTELTLCPAVPKAVSANFSTLDVTFPLPNQHSRSNSTSTSDSTSNSTTSSTTSSTRERERRTKFHTETLTPSNGSLFSAEKHTFHHTLPCSSPPIRERFEWRYSGGPFLRPGDRGRESGGLKLVRCTTGDVVAVYAGLGEGGDRDKRKNPRGVVGMMRFLSSGGDGVGLRGLEGEFEVLAVMSILTVVEKNKRAARKHRKALGAD